MKKSNRENKKTSLKKYLLKNTLSYNFDFNKIFKAAFFKKIPVLYDNYFKSFKIAPS